ncbi:MAG: hypothetical protein QOI78_8302 [Actinomycetota bacterium]|jgi:uncharacterized protein YjbJ (UPF0337 family)|nr:hypothetical protein [Actinomycetota bacterium]
MSERTEDFTRKLAGEVEEAAGQATGNERWVAEGKAEQDAAKSRPEDAKPGDPGR